jgi:hypothetical protein
MKEEKATSQGNWSCTKCGRPLEFCKVQVAYLGNAFFIDLPKCPVCGTVMVTEETAMGKLAEAEQILEDK